MNTGSKLGAYALVLAVALGGGALAGHVVGPISVDDDTAEGHAAEHAADTEAAAEPAPDAGVLSSQDGYTFDADTTTLHAGVAHDLDFRITGPDGTTVTDFVATHEGELQLTVVGSDLATYTRLHPVRADDGTWSVEVPALDPGTYRAFADFAVTGGPPLVLGVDLTVAGAGS
jgi:hypothetical protein